MFPFSTRGLLLPVFVLVSTVLSSFASPSTQRGLASSLPGGGASSPLGGGELIIFPEGTDQGGGLIEFGQSAGWVGWLSGWGWGEGELTILHPNSSDSEITFPSRAASFTPRISSFSSEDSTDDSSPPSSRNTSASNPFTGLLLPIHHFPNPHRLSTNISGCPPPNSRFHSMQVEEEEAFSIRGRAHFVERGGGADDPGHHGNSSTLPIIALVVRGDCHFSDKVRFAQKMGAKAVVVGDSAEEGESEESQRQRTTLLNMAGLGEDTSDLLIPAVFVSRSSYLVIQEELALSSLPSPGGIEIRLYEDLGWEWPLLDLLLLLLLLPSLLTLATLTVHHFRLVHKRHLDRASPAVVDALQTRIWTTEGWEKEESSSSEEDHVSEVPGETTPLLEGEGRDTEEDASQVVPGEEQEEGTAIASGSKPPPRTRRSTSHGPEDSAGPASGPQLPLMKRNDSSGKAKKKRVQRPREYYSIEECSICLEDFQQGEVVRILPCGHVFHKDEIDGWLKGWKKLCPSCKADITVPPPRRQLIKPARRAINMAPPRTSTTSTPTERTPLIAAAPTTPTSRTRSAADVEARAGQVERANVREGGEEVPSTVRSAFWFLISLFDD